MCPEVDLPPAVVDAAAERGHGLRFADIHRCQRRLAAFRRDPVVKLFQPAGGAGDGDNMAPQAVYDASGEGHVVWIRGADVVRATLSATTPQLVRAGSGSMAFHDTQLLTNGSGNLTLLWHQAADTGPAALAGRLGCPPGVQRIAAL